MQISRSEYDVFITTFVRRHKSGGEWEYLRFGQAWFNYFNIHRCHSDDKEGVMLDRIYNEMDTSTAKQLIEENFIMEGQ